SGFLDQFAATAVGQSILGQPPSHEGMDQSASQKNHLLFKTVKNARYGHWPFDQQVGIRG
ncbi:hypothetical protein, partial [Endozoicomonas sp. YOMI1]|uniref:hypothetical protein n=1 Tax=Endozoicomonas sp. YOMI1 TaxID=2828739 RepID=UPI002147B683